MDALLADAAGRPVRRALWLDAMDHLLRPHLAPSLAAHARLANVDRARLVYLVDSPVWHARLRLAAPELLAAARGIGLDVSELVVKTTREPLRTPQQVPRPAIPMSAAARESLQSALASLRPPAPSGNDDDLS